MKYRLRAYVDRLLCVCCLLYLNSLSVSTDCRVLSHTCIHIGLLSFGSQGLDKNNKAWNYFCLRLLNDNIIKCAKIDVTMTGWLLSSSDTDSSQQSYMYNRITGSLAVVEKPRDARRTGERRCCFFFNFHIAWPCVYPRLPNFTEIGIRIKNRMSDLTVLLAHNVFVRRLCTQGDSDVIMFHISASRFSPPSGRQKAENVCDCNIAETCFVGKLVIMRTFS